jgi:uncharacterized protein
MKELRIAGGRVVTRSSGKPGIKGYAAVFNRLSEDLGGFRETILPGAFRDCLATKPDVRCLFNHNPNLVLGRTRAGTLTLAEDDIGLRFDCDLPDTQTARDLRASIQRGDVDQCSFGFYVKSQKWARSAGEDLVRELHAVDLFDVSAVTYPAYPQTSVDERAWPLGYSPTSLRAVLEAGFKRDMERIARLEASPIHRRWEMMTELAKRRL